MKTYHILLLSLLSGLLLLNSCKSFSLAQLENGRKSTTKIPPLQPKFDLESFGPTYKDLYDIPGAIISGGVNPNVIVNNVTGTLTSAEDTKRLYQKYILRNICENVGETAGYATCRMGIRSRGVESWVNPALSILTLGIANLFGMKYATYEDNLEIYVDIENLNNAIIASYVGHGRGLAKAQPYKGYTVRDAKRMAHARAFKEAMDEIQEQIEVDSKKILAELIE